MIPILAFDIGKFNSMACVFNFNWKKCRSELVKSERGCLQAIIMKHKPDRVVMKSCGTSGRGRDPCEEPGCRCWQQRPGRRLAVADRQTEGPGKDCAQCQLRYAAR